MTFRYTYRAFPGRFDYSLAVFLRHLWCYTQGDWVLQLLVRVGCGREAQHYERSRLAPRYKRIGHLLYVPYFLGFKTVA